MSDPNYPPRECCDSVVDQYHREGCLLAATFGESMAWLRPPAFTSTSLRATSWYSTQAEKVLAVREYALDRIAYEKEHAEGGETPALLAVARDLLTIVGCPTCANRDTVGMMCQTCGTDYS